MSRSRCGTTRASRSTPSARRAGTLFAHGKNVKQVQVWLRHSQLTTTMNVYINQVDDGLGSADVG
jgi:integrase